jgi:hypothetical protein
VLCEVPALARQPLLHLLHAEHEESARRNWRVGATDSFASTALRFSNNLGVDEERHASLATLDYRPNRKVTLQAGAGVLLGGHIMAAGARFDFAPGFVSALGASFRIVDAKAAIPFVLLTAQLSYPSTLTGGVAYNALDIRAGVATGWTLLDILTPYVVARAFGGPVFWRYQGDAVTGTDVYHYQAGAGLSLLLGRRVDLFVEGVPLGELGVAAGLGLSL